MIETIGAIGSAIFFTLVVFIVVDESQLRINRLKAEIKAKKAKKKQKGVEDGRKESSAQD